MVGAVTSYTTSTGWFYGELTVGADGGVTAGTVVTQDNQTLSLTGGNLLAFPDQTVSGTIAASVQAGSCELRVMGQIGNSADLMLLGYRQHCGTDTPSAGGVILAIKNDGTVFDPAADMGGTWRFASVGVGGVDYGYAKGTLKLAANGSIQSGSSGTSSDSTTFTFSGGQLQLDATGALQGTLNITGGGGATLQGAAHGGKKLIGGVLTEAFGDGTGYALMLAVQTPAAATQADGAGSWGWLGVHSKSKNSEPDLGWVLGRFPVDATGLIGWNFAVTDTKEQFGFLPGAKLTVGTTTGALAGTLSFVGGGTLAVDTLLDASKELFLGTFKATMSDGSSPGWILGLRRDAPEPQACQPRATALPADTPTDGALAAGDCRSRINSTVFADNFSFSGTAGQVVTFDLTTADFWPQLVLFGPGGAALGAVDTESTGTLQLANFVLPENGSYVVEVSSLLPAATGSYTLTLSAGSACPAATVFTPGAGIGTKNTQAGTLQAGDCAGPFEREAYADRYNFVGSAGDIVTFELTAQNTITPALLLFNPGGEIASMAFGETGNTIQILKYRLPAAGTYTVAVSSDDPAQTGTYTLTSWFDTAANCTPAATALTLGAALAKNLLPAACASPFTNSPAHRYTFTGAAGDLLDVDLQIGMAQANLILSLLNSDGGLVAHHEDYAEFPGGQLRHIVLPASGSYTLEVAATWFGSDLDQTKGAPYRLLAKKTAAPGAPSISGFTPTTGAAAGVALTITGTNFGAAEGAVSFPGGGAAVIRSWANTAVAVTVPTGTTDGTLTLTTADGKSATKTFTLPNPTITSLSPVSGGVGTTVTVTGTNFGAAQGTITFVDAILAPLPAVIQQGTWTNTSVKVTVPVGAETGNLTLTRADGVSVAKTFKVPGPTITSLSPITGTVGMTVTIVGTNLGAATGTVTFNDSAGSATLVGAWSNTGMKVLVPADATTGNLTVMTADNRPARMPFTVPAPTIGSFSAASGTVGQSITINGTNFGLTPGTVRFAGSAGNATVSSWAIGAVKVVIPADAITGNLTLTRADGVFATKAFTVPAPVVTALVSPAGAVGTAVTLTGTNLGAVQGTGGVTFARTGGGTVAATVTNWANGSVKVTVPADATTGSVVLTRGDGVAAAGKTFTVPNPTINSLSPVSGAQGATVTITGKDFGTAQGAVTFVDASLNPLPAVIQANSWTNTSVKVTVPAGAETGTLTLSTADVPARTATKPFTVAGGPTFTLTPSIGTVGMTVVIGGTNLGATAGTVRFNNSQADATLAAGSTWTNTSVKVVVPADATTGDLTLTTAAGRVTRKAFTVPAPNIGSFTPASGTVGQSITINGTNFGLTPGTVRFAGSAGNATVSSWAIGAVKVVIPADAITGNLTLTRADGVAAPAKTFTVPAPTITSLTPASGKVGTAVSIVGTNLGVTAGTVTFNGTQASLVAGSVWTNTNVRVTVPAGATTGDLVVTRADGVKAPAKTFTVLP